MQLLLVYAIGRVCSHVVHDLALGWVDLPHPTDLDCRNRVGQTLMMFRPNRFAQEPLVVDVHTPSNMREAGNNLWPEHAATMVVSIAWILQKNLCKLHCCYTEVAAPTNVRIVGVVTLPKPWQSEHVFTMTGPGLILTSLCCCCYMRLNDAVL